MRMSSVEGASPRARAVRAGDSPARGAQRILDRFSLLRLPLCSPPSRPLLAFRKSLCYALTPCDNLGSQVDGISPERIEVTQDRSIGFIGLGDHELLEFFTVFSICGSVLAAHQPVKRKPLGNLGSVLGSPVCYRLYMSCL
jgi:hypothetical protein